jgi:hypothetical protein
MGILDDVVVNAKSAAEVVGKKAGQLVDVSKLRISAAEINSEITKKYQALGQYVYENCREALAEEEAVQTAATAIDELNTQYAAIVKEIGNKQNKVTCPSCGKQCSNSDQFCSTCGTKLTE